MPLPIQFLLFILVGWISRQQQDVIEYLKAENRALLEQLRGRRLRFTDAQRRGSRERQSHSEDGAATDFFTIEGITWRGLVRYFVLFVIDLKTRQVEIAGIVTSPDGACQIARNW